MGLATVHTVDRDLVCVLKGCDVPLILRRHKRKNSPFGLTGESYVHGLMTGKMWMVPWVEGKQPRDLHIR